MVGHHAQADVVRVAVRGIVPGLGAVLLPGHLRGPLEHGVDLVDLVHVVDALEDRCHALEPMPVSMFFLGRSPTMSKSTLLRTSPSEDCMKTRFTPP